MSKLKDLTGQKIGRLFVIKRLPNYIQENGRTRTRWLCKCDCGKEYIADGSHLLHGNVVSCGCLKNEKAAQRMSNAKGQEKHNSRTKDLLGQRFGKLVVIDKAHSIDRKKAWLCKCDCGNTSIVRANHLLRGLVNSCGCMLSSGELRTRLLLEKYFLTYKQQYSFPDLVGATGRRLKFDFGILYKDKLVALIEYQGIQHSKEYTKDFGRQQREETDIIKREYCKAHEIPLFYIWYNDNIEFELLSLLTKLDCMSIPCQSSVEEGVTTIQQE